MMTLPQTTLQRLKKLPRTHHLWECGVTPIQELGQCLGVPDRHGFLFLCVDVEDVDLRHIGGLPESDDYEAIGTAIIAAIAQPLGEGVQPARPKKIVVGDRSLQFFLRGLLGPLEIEVEYQGRSLLLADLVRELHETMPEAIQGKNQIQNDFLMPQALSLWEQKPWQYVRDCDVLRMRVHYRGVREEFYLSIMGLDGREQGIIIYRSQKSLLEFRSQLHSWDHAQGEIDFDQIFLNQDCLFLNFDGHPEHPHPPECFMGSITPQEGIRPLIEPLECVVMYFVLQGVEKICQDVRIQTHLTSGKPQLPPFSETYSLVPIADDLISQFLHHQDQGSPQLVKVKVQSCPNLTKELKAMEGAPLPNPDSDFPESPDFDREKLPQIHGDFVPPKAIVSVAGIHWAQVAMMTMEKRCYVDGSWQLLEAKMSDPQFLQRPLDGEQDNEQIPCIIIQTTRRQAKAMIHTLQQRGGVRRMGFLLGKNLDSQGDLDLGLIQTHNHDIHIFGEYNPQTPTHQQARQKWLERSAIARGECALIIAMGVTGKSRGCPETKEMLGIFHGQTISPTDDNFPDLKVSELPER